MEPTTKRETLQAGELVSHRRVDGHRRRRARTDVRAYETAATYLREIGRVRARQGQLDDWQQELATLRQGQRRKRRLVAILDSLATAIISTGQPDDQA